MGSQTIVRVWSNRPQAVSYPKILTEYGSAVTDTSSQVRPRKHESEVICAS